MKKQVLLSAYFMFMYAGTSLATTPSVVKTASGDINCAETLSFKKEKLADTEVVDLCQAYQGKVVMVVNTASFCGFTKQYKSLEGIYRKYKQEGFVVLGFPSNDFGEQEPGNEAQIKEFCERTFSVKFPMFEKTSVARGTDDPMYKTLARIACEYPSWNFHKYLLDRNGNLVASISSRTDPSSPAVTSKIESLL